VDVENSQVAFTEHHQGHNPYRRRAKQEFHCYGVSKIYFGYFLFLHVSEFFLIISDSFFGLPFPKKFGLTTVFFFFGESLESNFFSGIGGPCSVFDPPESYWCSDDNSGGGAAVFSVYVLSLTPFPLPPFTLSPLPAPLLYASSQLLISLQTATGMVLEPWTFLGKSIKSLQGISPPSTQAP
jgi:hypothetical protein